MGRVGRYWGKLMWIITIFCQCHRNLIMITFMCPIQTNQLERVFTCPMWVSLYLLIELNNLNCYCYRMEGKCKQSCECYPPLL